VNGIDFGSATITASAFGLTGSQSVQVTATLTFFPGNMTIAGNSRQFLSLLLSAPAPSGGLTINLTSSNTGVATVPATATFASGATNMTVPVTGVAGGLATITASGLPNLIPATATVIVALANGPASISPTSGTPQSAAINTAFAPFTVTVIDTGGHPMPGVTVTFMAPFAGPSGSFAGGVNTAMTNAAGVATSAIFAANSMIGAYNVAASVPGLATTASFALTNAPIITEYMVTLDGGPNEITVGPDGDLWFTEFNGDKIGRISPALTEFPLPSGSGPQGITVGPDGNVWFTESFRNKIGRMTTAGVITEFSLPTASYPSEIIVGPDGNLWFTESHGNKIGRINVAGTITEFSVPTAGAYPIGITAGPDANIWFAEYFGNKIGRITPAGVITEFSAFSGNFFPYGITAGRDGNLWFTGYGDHTSVGTKIGRLTTTGAITEFSIPSGDAADWIAAGSDGNLWFTEYGGNRIGRVTVAGAIAEFPVPTSGSRPSGITAGRDGNLWFTEYWVGKIGKVNLHAAGIVLPANLTVAPGQSVPFPVTLATPAPPGGVILTLTSSDTSKLTVTPANILIQAGSTAPPAPPRINGVGFGSATMSVSALGFPTVSQQVQVSATLSFSSPNLTISGNGRQFVALFLSAPAPDGGLTINLSSDNPGVASLPATVTFAAGATTVTIPVTGVAAGSANITASAPGVGAGTASVTVTK
jgi:streptogramin lyase